MKKFLPVIVITGILLVVLVVAVVGRKGGAGPGKKAGNARQSMAEAQKKQKAAGIMKEAQAAYDAKDYSKAIAKTQGLLNSVDNMSQEAKNLLQISQIRVMELSGQAGPAAAQAPAPANASPEIVVKAPVTENTK